MNKKDCYQSLLDLREYAVYMPWPGQTAQKIKESKNRLNNFIQMRKPMKADYSEVKPMRDLMKKAHIAHTAYKNKIEKLNACEAQKAYEYLVDSHQRLGVPVDHESIAKQVRQYYLGFAYKEKEVDQFKDELEHLKKIYIGAYTNASEKFESQQENIVRSMKSFIESFDKMKEVKDKLDILMKKMGCCPEEKRAECCSQCDKEDDE